MTRALTITNKLLSLRGKMPITDEQGELVYEARGEFAFFSPTWRLYSGDSELATIRKKIFAIPSTWLVGGNLGEFKLKKVFWSWVRRYKIIGGPFDDAKVSGDFWGLNFKIAHEGEEIARAKGKIFSPRDLHAIEVLDDNAQAELVTAISIITLHMDRKDQERSRSGGSHK